MRRYSQSTKPAYSDEQLVLEALDGSHLAFEQLIKQYQYRVLRTIASIISDEQAAQDVAQDTFLAAWRDLPKLREKQKFGRWLNQIAISSSRLWLRDQRKHQDKTVSLDEDAVVLTQELRYQQVRLRQQVWESSREPGLAISPDGQRLVFTDGRALKVMPGGIDTTHRKC